MALNWEKNNRAALWRRQGYVEAQAARVPPAAARGASEAQISYIQGLLTKRQRRALTRDEIGSLTVAGASRLIKELKDQQPVK